MIANKHTELRLVSNLNDLLEDSRARQDINKKIHKHTFEYMMTYVSNNDLEYKDIYDMLDELSSSYQRHSYNIAKEIKEEILEENGEEIEVYETIKGVQVEKKEIFLNPKKFTQQFKENLEEDLSNLVIDNFFKELDNVVKVFEYKKKIDSLRKKDKTSMFEEKKYEIQQLIEERIERYYNIYRNRGYAPSLVLKNMETNKEFKDEITQNSLYGVHDFLETEDNIKTLDNKIIQLSEKCRKDFIKNERTKLGISSKSNKVQVEIPRYVKAYAISKIFKDMTKW